MKAPKRGKVPKGKKPPSKHRFNAKRVTNGSGKPAKRKKTKRGPRQPALPTMEQVRHTALDKFAASMGEILDQEASHRADKESIRQGALKYMHDHGVNSYRFAKVEFLRSPGEEKLRIRTVRETGGMAGDDLGDDLDLDGQDDAGDETGDASAED